MADEKLPFYIVRNTITPKVFDPFHKRLFPPSSLLILFGTLLHKDSEKRSDPNNSNGCGDFFGIGFHNVPLPPDLACAQERKRIIKFQICIFLIIFLATTFARRTFVNYFTVLFYIIARNYWICILRRV